MGWGGAFRIILRDVLLVNPTLKIILMSATVEADIFSQYFGGCPTVTIPGYTFAVEIRYLEDAISLAKYDPKRSGGQQPRQNPGGRPGGGGGGGGAQTFNILEDAVAIVFGGGCSLHCVNVPIVASNCGIQLSGRESVPRLTDWTKFPVRTKQIVEQIDGDTARDKLEYEH